MTWVVTRYEPPTRIEFTCFVDPRYIFRLKIVLQPEADGTRMEWARAWLSLGPDGDAWMAAWKQDDFDRHTAVLKRQLEHYLQTGTILREENH